MDIAARLGAPHPYLTDRSDLLALLTYEAMAELARLAGSKRDWPKLERLDSEGLIEDYCDVMRLRARRKPDPDDDDAD